MKLIVDQYDLGSWGVSLENSDDVSLAGGYGDSLMAAFQDLGSS